MPSVVNFANRQVVEPGVYTQILGQFPTPPVTGTFGNVCIIDTGVGAGWGYGSGINGALQNGQNSIYQFNNLQDAQRGIRGGIIWDLLPFLFSPSNNGNGPQSLFYTRAATTTTALLATTFSSGAVTIAAINEGAGANGVLTGAILTRGYGWNLQTGIVDSTKFIMNFYEGQYRGADANGNEYDVPQASIPANTLVARSSEFSSINDFLLWAQNDFSFSQYFTIIASTASATALTSVDVTNYGTIQVLAGGTTVYNSTDVDAVLGNIVDLDNSMFLCLDWGITPTLTGQQKLDGANQGALSVSNGKILAYMQTTSTYTQKVMYIGGGDNALQYSRPGTSDGSLQIATFYNNDQVVLTHSGSKVVGQTTSTALPYRILPSIYTTAMVLGRISGLQPQTPGTYKDIRVLGMQHVLTYNQRVQALLGGVLHIRNVSTLGWVINQSINTMQKNNSIVYNDGTSPEISIIRIVHQINKELKIGMTPIFIGGNLNTSSPPEVVSYIKGYLQSRVATQQADNLLISWSNVQAVIDQDKIDASYCIIANSPVNRIFVTGVLLDPSTAAALGQS